LIEQQEVELKKRQTEIDCLKNELEWEKSVKIAYKNKFNDAKELLESWQTQDPEHHYEDFNPESLGCITRKFLEKK
jgi:hypothetical protein